MSTVTLYDTGMDYLQSREYFETAADWARQYCKSYARYIIVDLSDFSLTHDQAAEYLFEDEADELIFRLRWG